MAAKPIVAGTDGSEESLRAVDWAAREAVLRGAPLRIVSAATLLPRMVSRAGPTESEYDTVTDVLLKDRDRALAAASARAAKMAPGVLIDTDELTGQPAQAITEAGSGALMLVVGSRGGGAFERDQLDVPDRRPGQRRVLDHRHLPGQLGEQPNRPRHDLVEAVGPGQERLDRPALGPGHRLDRRQPVDEQPVSLFRGDPPGAGMRLGDEPLVLEDRHVIADRRGRHVKAVPVNERLRPHRFSGGHVVLDYRAEYR